MIHRRDLQRVTTRVLSRLLPHLREAHAWAGSVLDRITPPPADEALGPRWTNLAPPVEVWESRWYRYVLAEDSSGARINLVTNMTHSPYAGTTNVGDSEAYRRAMHVAGAIVEEKPPALAPVGRSNVECYFDFERPNDFEDLLARTEGRVPWGPGHVDVQFDDEGPNVTLPIPQA